MNYNTSCKQVVRGLWFWKSRHFDERMSDNKWRNYSCSTIWKEIKCNYTNPLHIQEEQIIEEQKNQLLKKNINFETYVECAKQLGEKITNVLML